MKKHPCTPALLICLCIYWLAPQTFVFAQSQANDNPQLGKYKSDSSAFFGIFRNFKDRSVPPVVLDNSPRIENLIHGGKLELTLADALALALENNLDIAVQRYIPEFSQTDLLRSQADSRRAGLRAGPLPEG